MNPLNINRRSFIKGASATLTLAALRTNGMNIFNPQAVRRVALIGTGWYGKSDLFRLMQVAPVEVVALCDVDKHQLQHAADTVIERQQDKKKPLLYNDYRKLLDENKLD